MSSSEIEDVLEAAGLSEAVIDAEAVQNGFTTIRSTSVSVSVPEGVEVRDPAAVLRFTMAAAWAVNDGEPDSTLMVTFHGADEVSWEEAAQEAGLELSQVSTAQHPKMLVESAEKSFGAWPGPVPDLARGALVSSDG